MLAAGAVLALGAAPPVGLWRYADAASRTAARGNPPATAPAAPAAHVATPILSARRLPGLAAGADPARDLRAKLASVPVSPASCLAVAVDGASVFAVQPEVAVVPASNLKLLTAAAALDVLSPTFRFLTSAVDLVDPDANGTIAGDLYLVGGGDPMLATEAYRSRDTDARHAGIPYTPLEQLADAVKANGVSAIAGAVVGVDTRYEQQYTLPTWPQGLDPGSNPGAISALRVNGGIDARRMPQADPAGTAAAAFADLLRARGIAVGAGAHAGTLTEAGHAIATVSSAPLDDIVGEMLRVSDNGTAEMLVREIAVATGEGNSTSAGLTVIAARLANWNLDPTTVQLVDGSGLSSENHVTCRVLLGVISRYAPGHPLWDGLAVAGTSGTLVDVFKDTEVAGKLRAKTGSLANVKSLTGALEREGHLLQFSYVVNEPGIGANGDSAVMPAWQALVDALLAFPYRPDLTPYQPLAAVPAS